MTSATGTGWVLLHRDPHVGDMVWTGWQEPAVVDSIDPDGRLHIHNQYVTGAVPWNHAVVVERSKR